MQSFIDERPRVVPDRFTVGPEEYIEIIEESLTGITKEGAYWDHERGCICVDPQAPIQVKLWALFDLAFHIAGAKLRRNNMLSPENLMGTAFGILACSGFVNGISPCDPAVLTRAISYYYNDSGPESP